MGLGFRGLGFILVFFLFRLTWFSDYFYCCYYLFDIIAVKLTNFTSATSTRNETLRRSIAPTINAKGGCVGVDKGAEKKMATALPGNDLPQDPKSPNLFPALNP